MSEQLNGLFMGKVVDNKDPLNLDRVKVEIAGIAEPSTGWARPMARGFGFAPTFGFFGIVPLNTNVLVMFEAGDIDSPWYMPADYPRSFKPAEIDNNNQWVLSFGDIRIGIQNNPSGKGILQIYSSNWGDNFIEINGENNSIKINALTNLEITATGKISINAGVVSIQDRDVIPGKDDI